MRKLYVDIVKEYIKLKPAYKETLEEIERNIAEMGITKDEFHEAIRQLSRGVPNSNIEPQKHGSTFSKIKNAWKFKKFLPKSRRSFILYASLITAGIFSILILATSSVQNKNQVAQVVKKPVETFQPRPEVVYASTKEVDAQKVFSYPASSLVPLPITSAPKKDILGFFPYWMIDKEDSVNLDYLTSLALFGLEASGKGDIITVHEDNKDDGGWDMWNDPKLTDLSKRAKNKHVKIYLTIKSFDNDNIESIAKNDVAQQKLITNTLYLVNLKNLDGVNFDFEYTGTPSTEVKNGFTRLVKNMSIALKQQLPGGFVSVDTYLSSGAIDGLFDIESLGQSADALVVMGYDVHTPLGSPGPISPMLGSTNIIAYMQNYLEKVTPDKLILAVPYYGYDWNISPTDPTATTSASILPYAQIADATKHMTIEWNDHDQTPWYSYSDTDGKHEVHFDNVRSLGIKYDYINEKNLRGVGIWALGYDGLNADLRNLLIDKFVQ